MGDAARNSLVISGPGPDGNPWLGLVANRAYRIVPGARAVPLDEDVPVPPLVAYEPSTNDGARPRFVSDEATLEPHKTLTDVLLVGTAYSTKGPVTTLETGVEVGAARKGVRVVGARRVEVTTDGRLGFTRPEPFTSMPLTWDHAYGGRDQFAEKRFKRDVQGFGQYEGDLGPFGGVIYPRNGSGRGYFLDLHRKRLQGAHMPNLEDPTDPVTPERILSATTLDWMDRPVAACYEPIDVLTFPRSALLLRPAFDPPTRQVHELSSGAIFPEDLTRPFDPRPPRHPRVYNRAPAGLAVCSLKGDERARLWNVHREHAFLEFALPADAPTFLLEVPGGGERKLTPALTTVSIEPDADRLVLTWSAALRVLAPYPEELTRSMRRVVAWSRALP